MHTTTSCPFSLRDYLVLYKNMFSYASQFEAYVHMYSNESFSFCSLFKTLPGIDLLNLFTVKSKQ